MNLDIRWGAFPGADIPGAFNQGLQTAQRNALLRRETALQDEALALRRQEGARAERRAQRQERQELSEQQQRMIEIGGSIIGRIRPRDQQSWDQALALFAQAGQDISQVPRQYDPNYVAQVEQAAAAIREYRQASRAPAQPTPLEREVEYYLRTGRPDLAEARRARGAVMTETYTNPQTGAIEMRVINPAQLFPSGGGGQASDEDEWEYEGGPSQNGSGGFPR